MGWITLLVTELVKVIPDIIAWIQTHKNPAQAAQQFVDHVKAFQKA